MRRIKVFLFPLIIASGLFHIHAFAQAATNDAELSVKKLETAPGLSVELFASEPLLQNPVAFSIDERGRFFISETHRYKDSIFDITRHTNWLMSDLSFRTVQDRSKFLAVEFSTNIDFLTKDSESVRLVEDRDGDGRAETSSVVADGFNQIVSGTAAGILARHGEIWFTCIPDLWKISLTNGGTRSASPQSNNTNSETRGTRLFGGTRSASSPSARPSEVKRDLLATGFGVHIGVSGHDLHGLVMGPDGKIYFGSGDRGFSVHTKEGKFLNNPDSGGVLRCNPDGSDMEIFATGLRNPQELAFDQYGNLFTDDNDTSGEDKSRVIYVVEGGDYGWRASYQFMDGYGPWVKETNWLGGIDGTLPWCGEVSQGPAGLAFYPGTGLPEKYKNHFLVCDFPKGVWSFAVKPKGASYEVIEKEKFLWNLGATDVGFGTEGGAYVSDWGQSYLMPERGRIFRVVDPALKTNSVVAEVKKLLAEGMEKRSPEELAKFLGHADMRVRQEAQFEFVRRRLTWIVTFYEVWPGRAKFLEDGANEPLRILIAQTEQTTNRLTRLHALRAIEQSSRLEPFLFLNGNLIADRDVEIRAAVAKTVANSPAESALNSLTILLKDESSRVRFFAAMSIGKLKDKKSISPVLEMLKQNADQDAYLVHAGVWALVNIGDFDAIQLAAKNENISIRRAALLAMRRMARPEIAQFLNDAEPKLAREAARAINDVPIDAAMPNLAAMLEETSSAPDLLLRAINANFRLGQNSNAIALANFVGNSTANDSLRAEALDALSDWEIPNPLDRVMGLWRPLPKREIEPARNALRSIAPQIFNSTSENVLLAAIHCVDKLRLPEFAPALFTIFKTSTNTPVRLEILQLFRHRDTKSLAPAVELALADPNPEMRRAGIEFVGEIDSEKSPVLLKKLLTTKTARSIQQEVFATLGKLKNKAADDILVEQLDLLLQNKTPAELQLDLLEAVSHRAVPEVKERLEKYRATLPQDDSLSAFRAVLKGGNAVRGRKIFNEREDLACLRCHAIKARGGTVGPDLGGISSRQTRDYFLESIVEPNKQIAAGYENILVTLKNGNSVAGIVKSEDDAELILNSPEDGIVKIKKSEIARRERGLSSMPEGIGNILTKFELRDLIEFLASLK